MKRINDLVFVNVMFGKDTIRRFGKIIDIYVDDQNKPRYYVKLWQAERCEVLDVETCYMDDAIEHMRKHVESSAGQLHWFNTTQSYGMVTNHHLLIKSWSSSGISWGFDFHQLNHCGDDFWSYHKPEMLVPVSFEDVVKAIKDF